MTESPDHECSSTTSDRLAGTVGAQKSSVTFMSRPHLHATEALSYGQNPKRAAAAASASTSASVAIRFFCWMSLFFVFPGEFKLGRLTV